MPELGTYGSVRGVPSNGHSYRDSWLRLQPGSQLSHWFNQRFVATTSRRT